MEAYVEADNEQARQDALDLLDALQKKDTSLTFWAERKKFLSYI